MYKYELSRVCPWITLREGRKYSYVTVDFFGCYDLFAEDYGEKLRNVVGTIIKAFLNYVVPKSKVWASELGWVVDEVRRIELPSSKVYIHRGRVWLSISPLHVAICAEKEVVDEFLDEVLRMFRSN